MLNFKVLPNHSLKGLNTFGFDQCAEYYSVARTENELMSGLSFASNKGVPVTILAEGSNVVLAGNLPGLVLRPDLKGIKVLDEDHSTAVVSVGAGENWHQFVQWCLSHDLSGLENLSLIPGSVGAAPIQNIGAYGVEQCETFLRLSSIERNTGREVCFQHDDCHFAYRDSIFKGRLLDQYIITQVVYRLRKDMQTRTGYGAIEDELKRMGADSITPKRVSEAICNIRRSKLPDPAEIGNAGSFFKNPVIAGDYFRQLQKKYPKIVGYLSDNDQVKVAAGWLIEHSGWKGYRNGEVGVHETQALVLVNYGRGEGAELLELARQIQRSVKDQYGIGLQPEPRIYPAP